MEFMIERGSQRRAKLLYTHFYCCFFDLVKWQKYVFPPLNHNLSTNAKSGMEKFEIIEKLTKILKYKSVVSIISS